MLDHHDLDSNSLINDPESRLAHGFNASKTLFRALLNYYRKFEDIKLNTFKEVRL